MSYTIYDELSEMMNEMDIKEAGYFAKDISVFLDRCVAEKEFGK
jgi:hypothetical protein